MSYPVPPEHHTATQQDRRRVRRNDFNLGLRLELIFEISEDLCLDNLQHLNLVLGRGAAGVGLQSPYEKELNRLNRM
jgi:hypothetical protein